MIIYDKENHIALIIYAVTRIRHFFKTGMH